MTAAIIFIVFGALVVLGGLIALIIVMAKGYDYEEYLAPLMSSFFGGIILIISLCVFQGKQEEAHWTQAVNEGYEFFVDGNEVLAENVSRTNYNYIKFDDENQKVLIGTQK